MLTDSEGQDFRQGTVRMLGLCSTLSRASARET